MSGAILEACLTRQIHSGLRLDVRLSLGPECGVVFGPSGAGKTSLLRLIAGLDRPDAGRVRLGEEVLFDAETGTSIPLRRRRIGMIFQDDRLFPHLSVADNIRFGLKGYPRAEAEARMVEVAALCGVGRLLDRRPEMLSGGERQRVGLARALAPRPRLLLCDEPVSALDVESRSTLVERLRAVQRAEAIPVLYVSHSPAEAIALGTRLFLLRDGRIVAAGSPLDVLAAPQPGPAPPLAGLRNVLPAVVTAHDPDGGETRLQLLGGPVLIVPYNGRAEGSPLMVAIRADDILLARGPIAGLSARNILAGKVERVVAHGAEAEVLVRTGAINWIVSVVASAVAALELAPDTDIRLIIKARSCRILDGEIGGP
ncbi:MAG: ATP-binding cassette domain-containing protein [Isosphaeraceae bacterium]|nr:ATP-binding cassette domain-containing protein [Isosphaeraceae bacterium]